MLLNILLGLLILVAISLTGIVLLQRSEGGALGMGGGGGQLMSARGATNLLTKTTQWLAGAFFVLAVTITVLTGREARSTSITDKMKIQAKDPAALLRQREALERQQQQQQPAPGAPAGGGFLPAPAPTVGQAPAPAATKTAQAPASKAKTPAAKTPAPAAPAPISAPPPTISLPTIPSPAPAQ